MKHLHVYANGQLIVIETNLGFALPYWQRQKELRSDIKFRLEIV